jgi:hypothetical protein
MMAATDAREAGWNANDSGLALRSWLPHDTGGKGSYGFMKDLGPTKFSSTLACMLVLQ